MIKLLSIMALLIAALCLLDCSISVIFFISMVVIAWYTSFIIAIILVVIGLICLPMMLPLIIIGFVVSIMIYDIINN